MSKLIRVIADWYPPSSLATATRLEPLVLALQEEGFRIIVHTDKVSRENPLVKPNIIKSPNNQQSTFSRLFSEILLGIELFWRLLLGRADLALISSPPFFSSWMACIGCILSGKDYVLDIRDKYPEVYAEAGVISKGGMIHRALVSVETWMYRKAKIVYSVTPNLVETINTQSRSEKAKILRNGFDSRYFALSKTKQEQFTVAFHGNLGRFQNPDLLVQTAKMVSNVNPSIRFLVIGDGPQASLFSSPESPQNIIYLGRLPQDQLAQEVAKCHVGVSFRTADKISINSNPVRIYEYLGVGIPVIATPSDSEGARFVEELGVGKSFNNNEAQAIANWIVELESNGLVYNQLLEQVKLSRSSYSRLSIARSFVKDIKSLWKAS